MITLDRIEFYFDYLLRKAHKTPHRLIHHNHIDIKSIIPYKKKYCASIYEYYKNNAFQFSPLTEKKVKKGDKERQIFQYELPDLLIQYCLSEFLAKSLKPYFIENLFSYQKGKSSNQALKKVLNYIRTYRKSNKASLKHQGLFVIRKDISQFSDSIQSDNSSLLIKNLSPILASFAWQDQNLIYEALNPLLKSGERLLHLPMGSPLVGYLTNYYLSDLDLTLAKNTDDLYIRFGDDILYITTDYSRFQAADATITSHCLKLNLKFNLKKSYNTYLTSCGRPYNNDKNLRHSHVFEYLGMKLSYDYGLTLTNDKYKEMLFELRQLLNQFTNLSTENDEKNKELIVAEVNSWLKLNSKKNILHLDKIIMLTDHHQYLKKIDRDIVFEILSSFNKKRTQKNFRNLAYKNLKTKYKLNSLVEYKNELFK